MNEKYDSCKGSENQALYRLLSLIAAKGAKDGARGAKTDYYVDGGVGVVRGQARQDVT